MHADGKFCVVWDPLDGSAIVDNNWAVGSIIGVWGAETGILGAIYVVYIHILTMIIGRDGHPRRGRPRPALFD